MVEEYLKHEQKSFDEWKKRYEEEDAWGLLTSVDVHGCNSEIIRNADKIRDYVIKLCERIEMKRFGECVIVNFGEDEKVAGYSMTQLIETSLISGHFANQTNRVFIDVFSCKPYSPDEVSEFTKEFFEGSKVKVHLAFRK